MWHPFRKYKNRKRIIEKYAKAEDIHCEVRSVKRYMIEVEFCIEHIVEKYKLNAIQQNVDPVEQIKTNIKYIATNAILEALVQTGRIK